MKKSSLPILLSILFIFTFTLQAGKLKGKIQKPGDDGMISFSLNGNGGTALSTGVSNAFSFNPNAGIEVTWGNFGLGLGASTFNTKSDFDFNAYAAPLKSLDFLTISGAGDTWKSSSITFGPSYSFSLRSVKPISGVGIVVKSNIKQSARITLSVKGGVTFNESPDFSIINKTSVKPFASYSASSDYQKTALTIIPSVAFSYYITQNLAISANLQYAVQTGQTAFTTGYKDLTNVSLATPISPDQFNKNISTAPNITSSTVGPDKYLSFGVGLSYSFARKGWDGSIKGNKKGITENGLKKNEADQITADADVKSIAETLVNMRKGWDGSVKGNKKGINENGLKTNEAKSENTGLTDVKAIAETLVNIARKGWDGSIKGNKAAYVPSENEIQIMTETLDNIRKGWDGSIKGNKAEYVANEAEIKAIAETMVNLRKGWDGSVKGGKSSKVLKTKHDTVKNSINNVR